MSRETILTSKAVIEAAPLDDYDYPDEEGNFTGTLVCRRWHPKKACLLCCFDVDDGRKIMLPAWWQSRGVSYSPKWTLINFADDATEGSRWYCEHLKTKGGYVSWKVAVPDAETQTISKGKRLADVLQPKGKLRTE